MSMHLQNDNIILRPLAPSDVPLLLNFFQDMNAMRYYLPQMWRTYNLEQLYGLLADWHDQVTDFVYSVRSADEEGALLGIVNLSGIDWTSHTAEIGVAIVDPAVRGRGLGTQTLTLMLNYAFEQMGLRRVFARVMSENDPSLRLFDKLGFTREGVMREHVARDGRFLDMILFGLLKNEWTMIE